MDRIKIGDIVALDKQGRFCIRTDAHGKDAGVMLLHGFGRFLVFADNLYAVFKIQEDRLCIELAEYGAETIPDENCICISPGQLGSIETITVASEGSINQDIIKEITRILSH